MAVVGFSAAPYVAYVHLKLPAAARRSRKALLRWSRHMPATTEVDMTTMGFVGTSRVTRTTLGRLEAKRAGRVLDISNLVIRKDPREEKVKRARSRWRSRRQLTKFFVLDSSRSGREPIVWGEFCSKVGLIKRQGPSP